MTRFWLVVMWCVAAASGRAASNVLLLVADDYGSDSCSLYNTNAAASLPPTPTLTGLARSGVVFRNAYANPLCSPTRACLITGRHAFRTGVGDVIDAPSDPALTAAEVTLPEVVSAAAPGVRLAQFGKWHLAAGANSPLTVGGWTNFNGVINGAIGNYTNWTRTVNGVSTANVSTYHTSAVVDDALAWIGAQGTNRWFAWVAFCAPHSPLHKPPAALLTGTVYAALSPLPAVIATNQRAYYEAAVSALDTEIGRLLAGVDRTNTTIIFVGDNGTPGQVIQPPYSSARAKATLYEGGTRVPLIVSGPAVTGTNREVATPVHVVDLFATMLDALGPGTAVPALANVTLDARSLMPGLQQTPDARTDTFAQQFGASFTTNSAGRLLRTARYKLIRFDSRVDQFFDLDADSAELTNLVASGMTSEQQANYHDHVLRLTAYQDTLAAPVITGTAFTNGAFRLTATVAAGATAALWRSADLLPLSWAPVTNAVVTGSNVVQLTDPAPPPGRAFYRVMAAGP